MQRDKEGGTVRDSIILSLLSLVFKVDNKCFSLTLHLFHSVSAEIDLGTVAR